MCEASSISSWRRSAVACSVTPEARNSKARSTTAGEYPAPVLDDFLRPAASNFAYNELSDPASTLVSFMLPRYGTM